MRVKELKEFLDKCDDDAYVIAIDSDDNLLNGAGSEIERAVAIAHDTEADCGTRCDDCVFLVF